MISFEMKNLLMIIYTILTNASFNQLSTLDDLFTKCEKYFSKDKDNCNIDSNWFELLKTWTSSSICVSSFSIWDGMVQWEECHPDWYPYDLQWSLNEWTKMHSNIQINATSVQSLLYFSVQLSLTKPSGIFMEWRLCYSLIVPTYIHRYDY